MTFQMDSFKEYIIYNCMNYLAQRKFDKYLNLSSRMIHFISR